MFCMKCERVGAMSAFSRSNCERCGKSITTPHIPSYKICEECAKYSGDCKQCGENIEDRNNSYNNAIEEGVIIKVGEGMSFTCKLQMLNSLNNYPHAIVIDPKGEFSKEGRDKFERK